MRRENGFDEAEIKMFRFVNEAIFKSVSVV